MSILILFRVPVTGPCLEEPDGFTGGWLEGGYLNLSLPPSATIISEMYVSQHSWEYLNLKSTSKYIEH